MAKQPCPDIGTAWDAYAQANGPPFLQLNNCGKGPPIYPDIRPTVCPLPWTSKKTMSWKIGVALAIIRLRLAPRLWTVRLNSSHPPTYDPWYLDGHFPLVIWQYRVSAAGQVEMRAEVCCVNQMAWGLKTLPGGMPGLKDVKWTNGLAPALPVGLEKDGHARSTQAMPVAHLSKSTILPAVAGDTTGGCVVLACICPLSPELTLSKCSRSATLDLR